LWKNDIEPLTHTVGAHKEWNESYYLCFSDRKNHLSGMTRLGFKPNKDEAMTFFLLFLPDGSVAGFQAIEHVKDFPLSLGAAGMVHERLLGGNWRYSFSGRMFTVRDPVDFAKIRQQPVLITGTPNVTLNLSFQPINPTYEYAKNMTPESLELGKKSGDEHWEQIALLNGEVKVGEKIYKLEDVIGERDHTHGVRDWTGIGDWLYYVVWFGADLAINPAAIIADDGRISVGGFLYKNGRNIPLKQIRIVEQRYRDDVVPVSSTLELIDADGEKHLLVAKAGPVVSLPFTDAGRVSVLAQSFGEFELDGRKGGYGTYETLRILRG
jgi:hypothetical protein